MSDEFSFPPDPGRDVCVHVDDTAPSCADCHDCEGCESQHKVDPMEPTVEPAAVMTKIIVDMGTIFPPDELKARSEQQPQPLTLHQETVDKYREAILRHIELNRTKGLDICASAVIYLQLMSRPKEMLATYVIQTIADVLAAYEELKASGIVSTSSTPIGVRPH